MYIYIYIYIYVCVCVCVCVCVLLYAMNSVFGADVVVQETTDNVKYR